MAKEKAALSASDIASLGGKARAASLSRRRKSEIGKTGADVRWAGSNKPLKAIADGEIEVGNRLFACAVLPDERRVLSERAFSRGIGAKRGGSHWARKRSDPHGAYLPVFLSANNLKPFISMDLAAALSEPILYLTTSGQRAHGIEAERIPQVLDVWLKARAAGALTEPQKKFAEIAEILMRSFAQTAIVALIDEATGYQDVRAKNALARILETYIAKELRPWIRTFPASFFKQMCRLKGIPFRDDFKFPPYFGHVVNDVVYKRLAPGVLRELQVRNPVVATGRRRHKHHQLLTENVGNPRLLHHLGRVEGIAEAFPDRAYDAFRERLEVVMRRYEPVDSLFEKDELEGPSDGSS
jgi:hypothetical protein